MAQKKHSVEVVDTSLEIDENLELHEAGWKFQKFGFAFIYGLVLLAVLGLFGNGLFSERTTAVAGAEVTYERFFRREAKMELTIAAKSATGSGAIVAFPVDYLRSFKVEAVFPEPTENKTVAGQVYYVFEGTGPMHLVFYLIPKSAGSIRGTVTVNNNPVLLSHFIYP